jgi:mono/diheme cytochrome c family protein
MRFIRKCIGVLLILIVLGVGGAAGFIYSGVYNVSAAAPDSPLVAWAVHQVYEHSTNIRSADIPVPDNLETADAVQAGARLYNKTCTACHGAPGETLSPIGAGINPSAPFLLKASRQNRPNLVFWVVKNGVRMTAMPNFGKSFSDQQIWQLAAFLHKDRGIAPADYTALVAPSKPQQPPAQQQPAPAPAPTQPQ